MSNSSIKDFMRNRAKEEEVVDVLAPETFIDSDGKRVTIKLKRLSTNHINKIFEQYNYTRSAKDEKGNLIIRNNRVVQENYSDFNSYLLRLIVDSLVFPDLHDKELMAFYGCVDVMDMPHAVFASNAEFSYVQDIILQLAGTIAGEEADCIVKEAKN